VTRPIRKVRWLLVWLACFAMAILSMLTGVVVLVAFSIENEQRHALLSVAAMVGAIAVIVRPLPPMLGVFWAVLVDLWQAVRARRW